MGGQSQESSQYAVPKSQAEKQLEQVQLEFAQEALGAYRNQVAYQALQQGVTPTAIRQLGEVSDPLSVLSPEQRANLVTEAYQQALTGSQQAGAISESELARIRGGGAATPEQQGYINTVAEAQLASGLSDISRYASQQREAVASELAPRLGLHTTDTPILDRAGRISAEAVNAAGRLASDVRGQQAQAMLQYPLQAAQVNQAQQQLGWSRSDVLADLNQRAFENRLALTGQVGQQGLGLATGYNVPAAQQSLKPTLATESSGWGFQIGSSRAIKRILAAPNGTEILKKLRDLDVAYWRYKRDEDQAEHIGPFAEDFRNAFGLGDGETIDYRDLIGLMLVAIQELSASAA